MKTENKKGKSKEEILKALKAKKEKAASTGKVGEITSPEIAKKLENSFGIKHDKKEETKVKKEKEESESDKRAFVYSQNRELENIANKIYQNLLAKFNDDLVNKGVQIADKVEMEKVLWSDKDSSKKLAGMAARGFRFAFTVVDPSDNYKPTGIMFQKLITKSVKLDK